MIFKLLALVGLSLFYLEVVGLGIATYWILKKDAGAGADLFLKLNEYDYMYFMLALSLIIMGMNTSRFDFKPLMIMPVRKSKISWFVIWDHLLSWPYLFLFTWLILVAGVFIYHGYPAVHLLAWLIIMMSISLWIGIIYFVSERNQWWNFVASALMFAAIITTRQAPQYFAWLGKGIYWLSTHPWIGVPLVVGFTVLLYYRVFLFLKGRLYLQHSAKSQTKASPSVVEKRLGFLSEGSVAGAFILNDLRLLLRNVRPKSILFGAVFSLLLSAVFFFAPIYRDNKFMQIFAALLVSGAFMYNFGGFVPAWDSAYIKLLVSQGVNFRQYVEAKWRLLVYSVLLLTVLALPYWFIDQHIYLLILAFALFNAGLNVYVVLWSGILNLTPVKLDEKVRAFQSGQSFNGKMVLVQLLKMFLPLILYFLLHLVLDERTTLLVIGGVGIAGFFLKNKALDYLARMYQRHKYKMVAKLSAAEE